MDKRGNMDLKKIDVPTWNEEFANIDTATIEQKKFYDFWVSEIDKNNFIDLKSNLSYVYAYLYSLIYEFIENENIEFFSARLDQIMKGYGHYPSVKKYLIDWKADAHLFLGDNENSLRVRKEIGFNMHNLETYGVLKEDCLIKGEVLVNLKSGYNCLTDFGKKNKSEIAEVIDVYLDEFKGLYGKNIVRHFLEDYNLNSLTKSDLNDLKQFFKYREDFQEHLKYYSPMSSDRRQYIHLDYFGIKKLSSKDLSRLKNNLDEGTYSKLVDFRGRYHYTEYNIDLSELNPSKLKLWKTILSKSEFSKLKKEYNFYLKTGFGVISLDLDMDSVLENYNFEDINKLKDIIDYLDLKMYIRSIQSEQFNAPQRVIENKLFHSVPKILRIESYTLNVPYIVIKALENEIKRIIRESEDIHREDRNLPKVGEGWVSETELYYKIKEAFPDDNIIHHGRPSWLGRQHLDIFFPQKNIAIEYQGLQHEQTIDFFGGDEGFENTQELDKRKKLLCEENNCNLIYVYPNYNFNDVEKKILEAKNKLKKDISKKKRFNRKI